MRVSSLKNASLCPFKDVLNPGDWKFGRREHPTLFNSLISLVARAIHQDWVWIHNNKRNMIYSYLNKVLCWIMFIHSFDSLPKTIPTLLSMLQITDSRQESILELWIICLQAKIFQICQQCFPSITKNLISMIILQ